MNAMAISSTSWNSARIMGPAFGGALLAFALASGIGPGAIFVVSASGYLLMFVSMMRVRLPRAKITSRNQSVGRALVEGFTYVVRNPVVLTLFLIVVANSLFGQSFLILMPVVARDVYGVDESGLGLLVACFGLGALVGYVGLAVFGTSGRRGLWALTGSAVFGVLLLLLSRSTLAVVSMPIIVAIGASATVYQTGAHTLLQSIVPDEMRGRVMANYSFVWSFLPVGGAMMGVMAEYLGGPNAILVGGTVVTLATLSCAIFNPALRTVD
jgi:hypothetical protein